MSKQLFSELKNNPSAETANAEIYEKLGINNVRKNI